MKKAKSKVHFSESIDQILQAVDFSRLGKKVAIKVHFGEKGCETYIDPELVRKVYKSLKSLGKESALVECNVLYKGSRTTSRDHIRTAREHGFDMPIEILDGEHGQDYIEVKGCKIGKGIANYDSLVAVTHFKGHIATGFGGAIKNIGMGLGSRAGKLDMHSAMHPSIIDEKCVGCGVCVERCNANAIVIDGGKAKIDGKKCEGCAMCIAVCENKAVMVPWRGRTSEQLQKKIAQYASAVSSLFPRAVFINVLHNITEECDCMGIRQKPMMRDIGILASDDIVSADKASLDLADKFSNGRFLRINPVNKEKQIELAEKLGLGSADYELINID